MSPTRGSPSRAGVARRCPSALNEPRRKASTTVLALRPAFPNQFLCQERSDRPHAHFRYRRSTALPAVQGPVRHAEQASGGKLTNATGDPRLADALTERYRLNHQQVVKTTTTPAGQVKEPEFRAELRIGLVAALDRIEQAR